MTVPRASASVAAELAALQGALESAAALLHPAWHAAPPVPPAPSGIPDGQGNAGSSNDEPGPAADEPSPGTSRGRRIAAGDASSGASSAVRGNVRGGGAGYRADEDGGAGVSSGARPGTGVAAAAPRAEGVRGGDARRNGAAEAAATARKGNRRRGPADPVRGLMHRHRELCSGAVDPLEIAAGLEAQGVTDGVAGRFRHRDVFSLAEELYVRVPRGEGSQPVQRAQQPQRLARRRAALHLLPGVVCAGAALAGPALRAEPLHVLVVAVVALALVVAATVAALRHGPLRAKGSAPTGSPPTGGALWTCWLLGFALYGERAVGSRPASGAVAALTALAFALGPAAWCARRFAVRAGARLAQSRSLADFASDVRPLLAGALALFLLAELALLCAAFAVSGVPVTAMALAGPAALGVLLFTARLLAVHGFPGPAAAGPGGACAIEALALAAALLHPLFPLVRVPDPAIVPVLACAAAAVALTAYAFRALARASAHLMPLTEAVPR